MPGGVDQSGAEAGGASARLLKRLDEVCYRRRGQGRKRRVVAESGQGAELEALGVDLVVIDQGIDTATPSGRLLFHRAFLLGALGEPGLRAPELHMAQPWHSTWADIGAMCWASAQCPANNSRSA
jgi:hypothetical protein